MLEFKDKKVAEKFESDFTGDPKVHVPGGTTGDGWAGKLSEITVAVAEKLIQQQSNLVRYKEDFSQAIDRNETTGSNEEEV